MTINKFCEHKKMFWGKTNGNKQTKQNKFNKKYLGRNKKHINIWDITNIRNKYMSIFSPMQWILYQFQKLLSLPNSLTLMRSKNQILVCCSFDWRHSWGNEHCELPPPPAPWSENFNINIENKVSWHPQGR